jgi:CcmD family protein
MMLSLLLSIDPDDARFGEGYAIAAYVVIFVGLFGYLFTLHAAERKLRARLERLERGVGLTES